MKYPSILLFFCLAASSFAEEEWSPEMDYAHVLGGTGAEKALSESAQSMVAGQTRWSGEVVEGFPARPLPLVSTWNTSHWTPQVYESLILDGQPVLMTFTDPSFLAEQLSHSEASKSPRLEQSRENIAARVAEYYRPGLEFARKHNLPIAFRGWNWVESIMRYQVQNAKAKGEEVAQASSALLTVNGKAENHADPFGPAAPWEEWGTLWFGNELMKQFQEIYPNPPLVLFINNNEAGEILIASGSLRGNWPLQKVRQIDRFRQQFGEGMRSDAQVSAAIREGYSKLYQALFDSAKSALISPAWKQNVRFVAYNTLVDTAYIGNGRVPSPGAGFTAQDGWTKWRNFDGSMPEFYDNDWQLGKRDDLPESMQVEAGNLAAYLPRVFEERPDFLNTMILWDGGSVSQIDRGLRGTSKPFFYATAGLRWNFERYEGWVQFCLWTVRPSLAMEFREPSVLMDAYHLGPWNALVNSALRPWTNPVLEEFWRNGELVPNTAEKPFLADYPPGTPDWIRNMERWFLLTTDANPPRESWSKYKRLSIFATALVVGDSPNQRWLIYAHAPQGGVSNASVEVPGFGSVLLPSIPRSGAFFLINEGQSSVEVIHWGGPEEITVQSLADATADWPGSQWHEPGAEVKFSVVGALQPGRAWEKVEWDFGDGNTASSAKLEGVTHSFAKPGSYLVTTTGFGEDGAKVQDQTVVHVGQKPDEWVLYDLPLDDAPSWEGPWQSVGEDGEALATYRLVPNRGSRGVAVMSGGSFVDDSERGRVLELTTPEAGIFLARHRETTVPPYETGTTDRTVSFWFKAEDVETRQVLYATGYRETGSNIYLDGGNLYAGSWAILDEEIKGTQPRRGYNWSGDWITAGPIEPGKWYEVKWVLEGGSNQVEQEKQSLYLNGQLAGRAPGAALPPEYVPPRVGRTNLLTSRAERQTLTRFHDQDAIDALPRNEQDPNIPAFRGRIDDFRFLNAAEK